MQLEQYLDQIIKWLQEIKQKNQVKGFIVGLSGGIDSAVTAFLLRKAVGDECLAVIMPCESDPKDAQDARLVAASCNIPVIEIDLTPTYQQWKRILIFFSNKFILIFRHYLMQIQKYGCEWLPFMRLPLNIIT